MNPYTALYYLSSLGGLTMIVGGIWLIAKEKIYINSETKEVTEVDIPFFGKLRTNAPALVLFFLGFAGLFYPIHKSGVAYLHVRGTVKSEFHPVGIYVITHETLLTSDGSFEVPVPDLSTSDYSPEVLYVAGTSYSTGAVDTSLAKKGVIKVDQAVILGSAQGKSYQPDVANLPAGFQR